MFPYPVYDPSSTNESPQTCYWADAEPETQVWFPSRGVGQDKAAESDTVLAPIPGLLLPFPIPSLLSSHLFLLPSFILPAQKVLPSSISHSYCQVFLVVIFGLWAQYQWHISSALQHFLRHPRPKAEQPSSLAQAHNIQHGTLLWNDCVTTVARDEDSSLWHKGHWYDPCLASSATAAAVTQHSQHGKQNFQTGLGWKIPWEDTVLSPVASGQFPMATRNFLLHQLNCFKGFYLILIWPC